MISYKVHALKPLVIKECAIGNGTSDNTSHPVHFLKHLGDLCGSVFLDLAFEKYITTIVGKYQYFNRSGDRKGIKESSRKRMMQQFEFGVKRAFSGAPDQNLSVDLKGVEDDDDVGIRDDTISLEV